MACIFLDRINLLVTVLPHTYYGVLVEYLDLCGYCLVFKVKSVDNSEIELKNIFCQKGLEYHSLFNMNIFSSVKQVRLNEENTQISYGRKVIKSTSGYKVAPMILCSPKNSEKIASITFRVVNSKTVSPEDYRSCVVDFGSLERRLIGLM